MILLHPQDVQFIQQFLYLKSVGAAAAQSVSTGEVPRGSTRIVVSASAFHNDAGNHTIQFFMMNDEGLDVRVPGTIDGTAISSSIMNMLARPIVLPERYHFGCWAEAALGAGKVLTVAMFYYDIIR